MSRDITAAADAAFAAENVPLLVLAQLDFDSGTTRVTNNAFDVQWNGYTWLGAGNLGSAEAVQEGADLQAYGLVLRLSGIPEGQLAIALDEQYQGRGATIWAAPLDANHRIIDEPVIVFKGRMDTMPISMGATGSIELNLESRLVDWERPRVRRYNDADQQQEYPGDFGLQFVEQMVEKELVWGRS